MRVENLKRLKSEKLRVKNLHSQLWKNLFNIDFDTSPLFTLHSPLTKKAFTLAEVLITLGIIGVVAAMTMPVLISKYNENVTMTKVKKFYSVMSQAQQRAIEEYGEVNTWDAISDEHAYDVENHIFPWFNKYFSPYIVKAEVSKTNDAVLVKFADGSILRFIGFGGGYCHFLYYTNFKTFNNKSALIGKDTFFFGFSMTDKSHPCLMRFNAYLCNQEINNLYNDPTLGCNSDSHIFCTRILQLNNWKIPDNYPLKL